MAVNVCDVLVKRRGKARSGAVQFSEYCRMQRGKGGELELTESEDSMARKCWLGTLVWWQTSKLTIDISNMDRLDVEHRNA